MARQVTLNGGLTNQMLPNGQRYAGGAVVILSDQEYSVLSASWKSANLSADTQVGGSSGAPLNSPAFTGTPTAPTASALTSSTQLATTAYADSAVGVETTRAGAAEALLAPLASPALTGTPTAPTKTALTNNTDIATTAYADAAVSVETSRATAAEALKLALAGGTMTGAINMGAHNLTNTGTPGISLPWFGGIFGDGSDGSVNFDGTSTVLTLAPASGVYTLTRDIFCTSLQVGGGGQATTIICNGWRIFCSGTVTIAANGTISVAGASASGTNQGTNGAAGSTGTLGGGRPGGNGATGNGAAGTAAAGVGTGSSGAGGAGGATTGGAAQSSSGSTGVGWLRTPFSALGTGIFTSNAAQRIDGGSGGSAGGGDGTNKGGAGGAGGGVIAVFAWAIVNNGTVTAAGGNGGSPSTVVTNGGCGGGGGGAGGLVLLYTLSAVTGSGSVSVAGGGLGTAVHNGSGTASNGGAGASGTYLNVVAA